MTVGTGSTHTPPTRFDEAPGVTPPTSTEGRPGFLTDVILELGFASRAVVDAAVEQSREVGEVAEEILLANGAITEEHLARARAERNGHAYVDLFQFPVDPQAMRLIGPATARRYRALPIAFDAADALVVAIVDPLDALAVSDIGVITKSEVRVAVATEAGVESILSTLPDPKPTKLSARGDDGYGVGRTAYAEEAGAGAWSLAGSISSPAPQGSPVPGAVTEQPAPAAVPEPPAVEPDAPAAPTPAGAEAQAEVQPALQSHIDSLVAAALQKHLDGSPGVTEDQQIAMARAEADRAREEADQAKAQLEALAARLEQLERGAQQPSEPKLADEDPRLNDHLESVMRELGGSGR